MAVFTSGELAMARAMRAAPSSLGAPRTTMVTNLLRALAVARDGLRQLSMTPATASSHVRHSPGPGRTPEAPLASSTSVSLVEVSPSTEMRL